MSFSKSEGITFGDSIIVHLQEEQYENAHAICIIVENQMQVLSQIGGTDYRADHSVRL
jgi:hypothetical protein